MTKDEALKLALEALDSSSKLINGQGTKFGLEGAMDGYYSGCFDVDGNNKLLNEAITAIKEALALTSTQCEKQPAQEQQNPMCMTKELESLLFSVNGDCYLGFEQEEKLVFIVRKQYEVKDE